MAYFKILSQQTFRGDDSPESEYLSSRPRLEPGASNIRSINAYPLHQDVHSTHYFVLQAELLTPIRLLG
jgi:hypothetical protein